MKDIIRVARSNPGVLAGGVAGFFLGGMAIGTVENMTAPIVGKVAGKFTRAAAAVLVSGVAFYAGSRMKNPEMAVAFGAVTLGHAIQSTMAAFQTPTS